MLLFHIFQEGEKLLILRRVNIHKHDIEARLENFFSLNKEAFPVRVAYPTLSQCNLGA